MSTPGRQGRLRSTTGRQERTIGARRSKGAAEPERAPVVSGVMSPAALLSLQRLAGNRAVVAQAVPMVIQRRVSDYGEVELTSDMIDNHVAANEATARSKTERRADSDKDVDANTVVKGTPASVATTVGEADDKHYEAGDDNHGWQWVPDVKLWHYDTSVKGGSGYKVDESEEHDGDVQVKLWMKTAGGKKKKSFVKVTGVSDADF